MTYLSLNFSAIQLLHLSLASVKMFARDGQCPLGQMVTGVYMLNFITRLTLEDILRLLRKNITQTVVTLQEVVLMVAAYIIFPKILCHGIDFLPFTMNKSYN